MRLLAILIVFCIVPLQPPAPVGRVGGAAAPSTSVRLEDIPWTEAESHLTRDSVVVIPLGAAAKEHGPHLTLGNDLTLATYLTRRAAAASAVVVAPTIPYHFYPAFLEYPGSTSLSLTTARDLVVDIVRSLAGYGPRRFYVLNTGISTVRALDPAVKILAGHGILVRYTDLKAKLDGASRAIRQQPAGSHADEIETSMMLYIDPSAVDMKKAVRDLGQESTSFGLTRQQGGKGTYSPSGVWGDATLATREKGRTIVESLVGGIVADIEELRKATPPVPAAPADPAPTGGGRSSAPAPPRPDPQTGCLAGEERTIRSVGPAFTLHWTNQDAEKFAWLWTAEGDIVHPDGLVERTAQVIRQNRAQLFQRSEYRGSRHMITLGNVRCITAQVAVADGKWELRGVSGAKGESLPLYEGLCTLVMRKAGAPSTSSGPGSWLIEAYRYTMKQPPGTVPPTLLKRPGYPG